MLSLSAPWSLLKAEWLAAVANTLSLSAKPHIPDFSADTQQQRSFPCASAVHSCACLHTGLRTLAHTLVLLPYCGGQAQPSASLLLPELLNALCPNYHRPCLQALQASVSFCSVVEEAVPELQQISFPVAAGAAVPVFSPISLVTNAWSGTSSLR